MKIKLTLAALAIALSLPALQGCAVGVIAAGTTVGIMSAHDRRTTGTQTDDESTEWKARARIPDQFRNFSNVTFTAYNRRLLLTGEVPSQEARAAIEAEMRKLEGVRDVFNELGIGPTSSLGSRSSDAVITSKVKARLVDEQKVSANHVKVVTERGVVHLMGIVNQREAQAAINVARTTSGVRKVVNIFEVVSEGDTQRLDTQALGGRQNEPVAQPAPVENR